uniref:CSON003531 protein n=1 Tax=Culicoides sonorensis TaxID=179676 RepID=A0A336L301_CULSO
MEIRYQFIYLLALYFLNYLQHVHSGVSMDQLRQTGTLLRQSCQPKFKLTDEQADAIRDGAMPDYKEGKCYLNCLLEMLGVLKKGKILADKAIKTAETMLPPEMKDEFIAGINICKDIPLGKDACENALIIAKCAIDNIPQFFLP